MTQHDEISAIARQHLGLLTLATQRSDSLDFHELAVWQIEAAVDAAYRAGQRASGGILAAAEALVAAKDNQMETVAEWRALRRAIKAARKNA